ncbi:hypothetical protein EMIHUDRAFT_244003 [Emiliania huxleyi CCMP1516]|uniref:Uncharacterized protein n=2 Tax=Emiliania huxleyi TaxID=2903 RepID=A0A0D3J222_EMIH1|nr:hypothetical protein EMIHUDRAFT_244003 [Emiliania huxleyi CCMP1516]EOD17557.1 hypothetical protein EMIHUDRAFT_244003 [Emiliania huxleyi CCMP1516]|eukprot:XP_005769986.1 hypothetical protein EMIHUDRAFT_244003 [Emiliania huxleyi CCMP1516]
MIREPLRTIRSRYNHGNVAAFGHTSECNTQISVNSSLSEKQKNLQKTLQHYVLWHTFGEVISEKSLRAEDTTDLGRLTETIDSLSQLTGRPVQVSQSMLQALLTDRNHSNSAKTQKKHAVTWAMLAAIDPPFTTMCQMLALRHGYYIPESELVPDLQDAQHHPQQHCALDEQGRFGCWLQRMEE